VTHFHEEQQFRQPWLLVLLMALAIPAVIVAIDVATRQPALLLPALLLGPGVIAAIALLFAMARLVVDVDREAITVAFHFLWPKRRIRISEVRKAEAMKYSPFRDYGGYGVRLGFRGWAFNTSGDEGVLVETNDGSRLMIGSQRPKELEAAIERAKRQLEGHPG
jgi:hypothetical protein